MREAEKKEVVMKYTEGYWLRKESIQASFAAQAFKVRPIENGMRITAPERPILSRADALDQTVLPLDFVSAGHNDIEIILHHDMGYESGEPAFALHREPDPVTVDINEEEAFVIKMLLKDVNHLHILLFQVG